MISYGPDSTPDFVDGTVGTYTCNSGYVLVGAATRTCVVPEGSLVGAFNGVAATCVGKCSNCVSKVN